jgi:hypothetical protein
MERNKEHDAEGDFGEGAADMVESAGETTAAATGSAEIGATKGETTNDSPGGARPVGADTMVEVAGETGAGKKD